MGKTKVEFIPAFLWTKRDLIENDGMTQWDCIRPRIANSAQNRERDPQADAVLV